MKLSIVIPVYNAQKYLKRCMDSIIEQIDEEVEVILVDDGSTDSSLQICKSYESKNVIVIHQQNCGEGAARNAGIKKCRGEWITFVDADDSVSDDFYIVFKNNVEESVDVIVFEFQLIKNNSILTDGVEEKKDVVIYYDAKEREKLIRCNFLARSVDSRFKVLMRSACGKFFRRSLLENNDIQFSEGVRIGTDMIFTLNVYSVYSRLKFVQGKLYNYYQNDDSITYRYKPDYEDMVKEYDEALGSWLEKNTSFADYFYNYRLNDIILYMKYDFFHKNNVSSTKEKKKKMKRIFKDGVYCSYYKKAKKRGLLYSYSWVKRVTFWCAIHNFFTILKVISSIKYRV